MERSNIRWFLAIVLCGLCASSAFSGEDLEPPEDSGEIIGYDYTVKTGDTLRGLAAKFYQDTEKYIVIQEANDGMNPDELKAGDRIRIPLTAAQKALWEERAKPVSGKIVKWLTARLDAMGLSSGSGADKTLSLAVGMGFYVFIALNFVIMGALLVWVASKIVRMTESSFHNALVCTGAEVFSVISLFYMLTWVLNYLSDIKKLASLVNSGGPYFLITLLVILDLSVLRIVYRVGWGRALLLSISRLASIAVVCLVLFGVAAVITSLSPPAPPA